MAKLMRAFLRLVVRWLPPGAPRTVYTTLTSLPLVRQLTNALLRYVLPERLNLGGLTLVLNPRDAVVGGALTFGIYEPLESKLFTQALKPGETVIDIGANIGYYTALAAAAVGQNGRVYAFEPDPVSRQYLTGTVQANRFRNVTIVPLAIGASNGHGQLFRSADNQGDHRIYKHKAAVDAVPIQLTSLDDWLAQHRVNKVAMIKIDIQGAEWLAVQGMSGFLASALPIKLFLEYWPEGIKRLGGDPQELLEQLQRYGLALHDIDEVRGQLVTVTNMADFVRRYQGARYTNLFCERA